MFREQEEVKKLVDDWYVNLTLPKSLFCGIANTLEKEF
jgi:hypothetical protein